VMFVRWEGRCASVLWHGVIDRRLATPSCSRRVDKGVEKGVETLSRFHGSVTGSRFPCHPPLPSRLLVHGTCITLPFTPTRPDSCVCSCRCRGDRICKLCASRRFRDAAYPAARSTLLREMFTFFTEMVRGGTQRIIRIRRDKSSRLL